MNSVLMSRGMTIFVLWISRLSLRYGVKSKVRSGLVRFFLHEIFKALQIELVIIARYDILYKLFRQVSPK